MKAKLLTIGLSALASGILSAWSVPFAMNAYIGSLTLEQQEESGRILRSIASNQIAPLVGFVAAISAGSSVFFALGKFTAAQPRSVDEFVMQRLKDPELTPGESDALLAHLKVIENHRPF